ncbi:hypothetical protein NN561_010469 [Cricetulus griseus]
MKLQTPLNSHHLGARAEAKGGGCSPSPSPGVGEKVTNRQEADTRASSAIFSLKLATKTAKGEWGAVDEPDPEHPVFPGQSLNAEDRCALGWARHVCSTWSGG